MKPVRSTPREDHASELTISKVHEVGLWDGGITFHTLALIVGAVFALIAGGVSFYLIMCHATHYSKPLEQRQ